MVNDPVVHEFFEALEPDIRIDWFLYEVIQSSN